MRMILIIVGALVAWGGFLPRGAHAQRVPFVFPAGTGFDPEISVVNSGQVLDAQAVVSNDLKYVTINARASSSRLVALRQFTFQNGAGTRLGFVGGARSAAAPAANARVNGPHGNLLDRPGTTLIGRLDD